MAFTVALGTSTAAATSGATAAYTTPPWPPHLVLKPAARAWLSSAPSNRLLRSSTLTRPPSGSPQLNYVLELKLRFLGAYAEGRPFETRRPISSSETSIPQYRALMARCLALVMYSSIDPPLVMRNSRRIHSYFTVFVVSCTIQSFPCLRGSFGPITMFAMILSFSAVLASILHTVGDCSTICVPYSRSDSLRDFFSVINIGQL